MFLGLRTVIYHVSDLARARDWYASVLGRPPYFDQPYYVGFNVGGFELGLDPDWSGYSPTIGSHVAYWGVADAAAAYQRLIDFGARPHDPIKDVGEGIKVATVVDPFGNVIGIIEDPHFPWS